MGETKCKTCIHNGCHYDICINCNGENLYNYKSDLLTKNIFQLKDIQYFISKIGEYEDLNEEDM